MLYMCCWMNEEKTMQAHGFVKAKSPERAKQIMLENLQKGYEVTEIVPAYECWITPQSLTVNFANMTEYSLFG